MCPLLFRSSSVYGKISKKKLNFFCTENPARPVATLHITISFSNSRRNKRWLSALRVRVACRLPSALQILKSILLYPILFCLHSQRNSLHITIKNWLKLCILILLAIFYRMTVLKTRIQNTVAIFRQHV